MVNASRLGAVPQQTPARGRSPRNEVDSPPNRPPPPAHSRGSASHEKEHWPAAPAPAPTPGTTVRASWRWRHQPPRRAPVNSMQLVKFPAYNPAAVSDRPRCMPARGTPRAPGNARDNGRERPLGIPDGPSRSGPLYIGLMRNIDEFPAGKPRATQRRPRYRRRRPLRAPGHAPDNGHGVSNHHCPRSHKGATMGAAADAAAGGSAGSTTAVQIRR